MGVFRRLIGTKLDVVQIRHSLTEGRDAGCGAVFARRDGDVDVSGLVEGIWDVVFNLGCSLAEITPFTWVFSEAVLICSLGRPDNTAVKMTSAITVERHTPLIHARGRFARIQARVFIMAEMLQALPEPLVW